MLILSISGVYAEGFNVQSSVMTQSPISADVDTGLSSCDAFNNDLSNVYEPSDSFNSHASKDWHGYYESSDSPHINEKFSAVRFDNSDGYCKSPDRIAIDVDYNIDSDCSESVDVPVVDVNLTLGEACDCPEILSVPAADIDVDCEYSDIQVRDECFKNGEINPAIDFAEDKVILNNYNSFSKDILESIYIPVPDQNNQHDGDGLNGTGTIISEVTGDMETSERYKLIGYVTQVDNLLNFESVDAVLAINVASIPNGEASEPVFDGILRASEYISNVEEVYFGTLSKQDSEKLLESVGSENTLLFASIANWYPDVTLDTLQKLADHGQICEDILDGYTVTKALLRYYPLTNELYIYKFSDNEDEHGHLINDTDSHGLDYAYKKHVNVVNKDMPNLIVITSYGVVFIEEQVSVGDFDSLDDILGAGISSETLLPDHKAIWTPLLLLSQQDLQKSILNCHGDDSKNESETDTFSNMQDSNLDSSCKDTQCHCLDGKYSCHCGCHDGKYCCCNSHCGRQNHQYQKHWGYSYKSSSYYASANAVPDAGLAKADNAAGNLTKVNSTVNSNKNSTKNSTDDKTNSSNVTTNGKKKTIESPKTEQKAEPTYTLVYAILGIAMISILFNSSYMRRDD